MSPPTLVDKMVSILVPGSKWNMEWEYPDSSSRSTKCEVASLQNPGVGGAGGGFVVWTSQRSEMPSEKEIITATPGLVHWKYNWGMELEIKCTPVESQRHLLDG